MKLTEQQRSLVIEGLKGVIAATLTIDKLYVPQAQRRNKRERARRLIAKLQS